MSVRTKSVPDDWIPFGHVPELAPRDLALAIERGERLLLIDVRSRLEHAASRIPGARSLPILGWPGAIEDLVQDPACRLVAICLSAHRSIPAVRMLRARGHDAVQLAGGMIAWWAASLPTER